MTFMLRSLLIMLPLIAGTAHATDARAAGDDPAIDHKVMDLKADPCGNFFRYACGGWIDANPIPADQSSWGLDQVLTQRNQLQLRTILEKAAPIRRRRRGRSGTSMPHAWTRRGSKNSASSRSSLSWQRSTR